MIISAFSNSAVKKPVQDQNSPLTVPAVETEQPPPKPKKFFKSRNAEPYPPVPQITYAPPVSAAPLSPEHPSNSKEKKNAKRSRVYNRDSSSPELPRRNSDKTKTKKSSVATKAARKEDPNNTQPPNKRYLVRNRDKVINYAEDGSNSPIPDFSHYEPPPPKLPSPKIPSPKASPIIASPTQLKAEVVSPSTSKDGNDERKPPPIVLRISKGTSRIVSTDSNEGFTSPSSDRHSSMDTHSDIGSDHKKSPSMETICSPKHEGLKITIKCAGLNQEIKKEKKKEKKEHKSHKRHHKNVEEEPTKKITSPLPGSDAYDLYKTLASPIHDNDKEGNKLDDIESQLAKLDSAGSISKSPSLEVQHQELPPEPKPPESSSGRSRRNRPNINYSENDDYLDVLTSNYSNKYGTKTVSDIKKEGRKVKKKQEPIAESVVDAQEEDTEGIEKECPSQKSELIDILSGTAETGNTSNETYKVKPGKKQKRKHSKHSSPDYTSDFQESNIQGKHESLQLKVPIEVENTESSTTPSCSTTESQSYSQPVQSSDSAYNSCPNENSEEESQKNQNEDMFKSPCGMSETEEQLEDKPSVKLVITKKKGSIFKSKSLVNDNPSPLPARKRRHLYRHEWANDVSMNVINLSMSLSIIIIRSR